MEQLMGFADLRSTAFLEKPSKSRPARFLIKIGEPTKTRTPPESVPKFFFFVFFY